MPANTSLADLTAVQAIAMLCARDTTAVAYTQALFDRYDSGGFECLNAFISLNRSQARSGSTFLHIAYYAKSVYIDVDLGSSERRCCLLLLCSLCALFVCHDISACLCSI